MEKRKRGEIVVTEVNPRKRRGRKKVWTKGGTRWEVNRRADRTGQKQWGGGAKKMSKGRGDPSGGSASRRFRGKGKRGRKKTSLR